jgi:excisionase family DNA binding protein
MATPTGDGEILTIKRVTTDLDVTERTLNRLAAARRIPAFKVGGTSRFSRADIDNWIRHQSTGGPEASRAEDNAAKGRSTDGERKQCLD